MKGLLIGIISVWISLSSCSDAKTTSQINARKGAVVDSLPGECPFLTKDAKGNTVLSWVRMMDDSTTSFCYAVVTGDKKLSNPVIIPGTSNIQPHGENLPKIIFKPSGEIIALWGAGNPNPKNKYSGLVYYVQSLDEGKTWTSPKPLVSDTASYDQRYYDIALLPNGEAAITWLDNRKTTKLQGSGMYFASTDGKNGFTNGKLISQPCCQCCRTDLFIDSKNNIHVLYRGIIQDSIRDMVHIVSKDQGKSFSEPVRISDDNWVINGCPHTGPAMAETKEGLQFAWFTGGKNKGCYYASSTDDGAHFTPRNAISELGSHPQLAAISDNDVLVVWDEAVQVGKDFFKRIGVQRRNQEEVVSGKQFITADTLTATYPVVTAIDKNASVIAYTVKKKNKNYIEYQIVED